MVIIKAVAASNTYIWRGTVSTDWTNAANWSPAIIPTVNNDVLIPGVTPFVATIKNGVNGFCKSIQVDPNATINVVAGGHLNTGL